MRIELRLALVWLLYFAGFGLYFPYWSLYLTENAGLSGSQAGVVMAALSLMGILAQPFWGQIADRTGSRTRVLLAIGLGAGLGFGTLFVASGFAQLTLANALFAVFHTAMIPMTVAVSLALLRDGSRHAFGLVRSVGTLGFVGMALVFPRVLDRVQEIRGWDAVEGGPTEPGLEWMFPVSASFALLAALATLTLPRTGAVALRADRGDWRALLRHPPYVRLALFAVVTYFVLHGPMLFFPRLVTEHGGTLETISNMWLPMVALEVPGLAFSGMLVGRVGPRGLMSIGLLAAGVRWLLCGFEPTLPVIYLACFLHGVTVAGLMMGNPLYVEATVPEKLRATGQGLLATCVHFGAMLSSLATGWLVDAFGILMPYRLGGLAALVLLALMPWILPAPHRPEEAAGA
jgi:PPP family 3-phenylpropionic acid transporter